jgi:hypothetical protein
MSALALASYSAFLFVFVATMVGWFAGAHLMSYWEISIGTGTISAVSVWVLWLSPASIAMILVARIWSRRLSVSLTGPLLIAAILAGISVYRPLDYFSCRSFHGIPYPSGCESFF